MTRFQRILAIILVLQISLSAFVLWPRTSAAAETVTLFPGIETADIESLILADNTGQRVELQRLASGWTLANSDDFPADSAKIEALLAKITALQTSRLVTQSAASHKRLQVDEDDFVRRVEMTLKDGPVQSFFVGSSPNPSATHIRRSDQDETYLVTDLASWEVGATAQSWIDAAYVNLNREEITRIILENAHGSFQFDKQPDDTWTMLGLTEDETLYMDNFNPILNQTVGLRMVAPLGLEDKPEYGLADPLAKITITSVSAEDNSTTSRVLRIGAQLAEGTDYAAKWSESSYYVRVAEFSVQDLINRTRDELIQPPATPVPVQ